MPKVSQSPAARRDLVEHFVHLAENAGLEVAERFLTRVEMSCNDLAKQPLMGAPLKLRHPALAGIRKWRVRDFDNHLLFYLSRTDEVFVVRVLHAAQDWWSVLDIDH